MSESSREQPISPEEQIRQLEEQLNKEKARREETEKDLKGAQEAQKLDWGAIKELREKNRKLEQDHDYWKAQVIALQKLIEILQKKERGESTPDGRRGDTEITRNPSDFVTTEEAEAILGAIKSESGEEDKKKIPQPKEGEEGLLKE